ncbi:MAG: HNH endonuclease signature motif containing protein [Candidatus Krumholzibacteriia bacterium]
MLRNEPSNLVNSGFHPIDRLSPRREAVHRNFIQSTRDLRRDIVRVVYYLERICSLKIHSALGFGTIEDYAFKVAGFSVAQTRRFLLLGHKLQNYPEIARALSAGDLSFTKAVMICTMTEPHHQQEMLDLARTLTSRALKKHLAAAGGGGGGGGGEVASGSAATDPRPPRSSPEAEPCAAPGGTAGHADAPEVGDPGVDGRSGEAPDEVAPATARQEPTRAGRDAIKSTPGEQPRAATPDHGLTDPLPKDSPLEYLTIRFSAEQYQRWSNLVDHSRRHGVNLPIGDLILQGLESINRSRDGNESTPPPYLVVILKCPDCGRASVPSRSGEAPVPAALENAAACDATIEDGTGRRRSLIPPRTRRLALQRARMRCEAPGCDQMRMLEVHHRRPIADGGSNDLGNLVVLCWRCHRAHHTTENAADEAIAQAPV